MNTYLTCIRPLPTTGAWPMTRAELRRNDYVRCLCGAPTCRDADVKGKS